VTVLSHSDAESDPLDGGAAGNNGGRASDTREGAREMEAKNVNTMATETSARLYAERKTPAGFLYRHNYIIDPDGFIARIEAPWGTQVYKLTFEANGYIRLDALCERGGEQTDEPIAVMPVSKNAIEVYIG